MSGINPTPVFSSQSKHDKRAAAIQIIQEKLGDDKVKVLDPNATLEGHAPNGTAENAANVNATSSSVKEEHYNCITEKFDPSSVASILVGVFTEIPRWKSGSTVNFAAYAGGYPKKGDAVFAALQLWKAAQQWNSYDLGVNFNWVGNLEDATFVLEYGGNKGGVLASAFFPNAQPLNTLFVYDLALSSDQYRGILTNIFLHELGHTLGLRHEFAMDPERYEGGAVVYGTRNQSSVMSYQFPPQVQDSDIKDTKGFYKVQASVHGGLSIKDYIPG